MSTIIQEIQKKMTKFPHARVERGDSSITYQPDTTDGFTVRLKVKQTAAGEQYSIYYNGSHEEFSHRHTAIMNFGFGLSTGCRLREYSRSGRAYRWTVEAWSPRRKRWEPDWEIVDFCALFSRFWQRPTVRYLQNRLIDLESGADSCGCPV